MSFLAVIYSELNDVLVTHEWHFIL